MPASADTMATPPSKGSIVVNGVSEFECHGEILECDPPRVLVYTWIANWHDDDVPSARWSVGNSRPKQGGTHVKVTHSGLANLPVARKDYSGGWPGVVEMLKKFVEGNEVHSGSGCQILDRRSRLRRYGCALIPKQRTLVA